MVNSLAPQTASAAGEMPPEEENKQQRALLRALLVTVEHFFGSFSRLFRPVADPRQPTLITYPLPTPPSVLRGWVVLATGVLMFLLRFGARRQIQHWLRRNTPSARKFEALFEVAGCPHGDTVNYAFA